MRIILTKFGNKQVSELEDLNQTKKPLKKSKRNNYSIPEDESFNGMNSRNKNGEEVYEPKTKRDINLNTSNLKVKEVKFTTTKTEQNKSSFPNIFGLNRDNSKSTILKSNDKGNIISRKHINIQLKKPNVTKNDIDKYILDETKTNIISKDLPEDIANKHVASLKIHEILKPITYVKLKDKFKHEEFVKSNLFKVDEKHFRSVFEPSNIDKFNAQVSRDIDRDNINLIKYLHSKDEVSQKLVEKLHSFDDSKLTKINRICKIYFHYENYEKKAKEKIKEKLKGFEESKKMHIKKVVNELDDNLKTFSNILNDYPEKSEKTKKKIYRDKHYEFQVKYWKAKASDRYNEPTKGNLTSSSTLNSLSNN